jgi:ketosteroid isomerase-like protein
MKKSFFTVMILICSLISYNQAFAESQPANKQFIADVSTSEAAINQDGHPLTNYIEEGYEDVHKVFDQFMVGYLHENLDAVLETLPDNEHVVFIGSGSRAILVGKNNIKEVFEHDFKAMDDFDVNIPWLYIFGEGKVAWLNAIALAVYKTEDETEHVIKSRITMVFQKIDDNWKIINLHFSFPAAIARQETIKIEEVEVEINDR